MDAKPWWWKPLWITTLVIIVLSAPVAYFIQRIPLERIVIRLALGFLMIGFAYYIRVILSVKANRAIYIMLGACGIWGITFFGGAFLIKVLGLPKPVDIIGS